MDILVQFFLFFIVYLSPFSHFILFILCYSFFFIYIYLKNNIYFLRFVFLSSINFIKKKIFFSSILILNHSRNSTLPPPPLNFIGSYFFSFGFLKMNTNKQKILSEIEDFESADTRGRFRYARVVVARRFGTDVQVTLGASFSLVYIVYFFLFASVSV